MYMINFIKTDIKRVFTEPAFYISVCLNLLLLFGAFFYLLTSGNTNALYENSQSFALPFAAPVLAAMPYSTMIMLEKGTRFGTLINIKERRKGYELRRLLACGISGGAALFIPQFILFCVCAVMGCCGDAGYAAASLSLPLSFGFGYAAFSYGLTFLNRHSYIPMILPQVLYLLCTYAFPYLKLESFYPPLDISPSIYGGSVSVERFIIPAVLTAAAFALAAIGKAGDRK